MKEFETKDSGVREEFDTGMVRDTASGKPRFDLICPEDLPFDEQMLTRWARLMGRGGTKYGERNWEKAATDKERRRFRDSAFRHFMQWYCGCTDEDHAAAVYFNISGAEMVEHRLANPHRVTITPWTPEELSGLGQTIISNVVGGA